MTVFRLAPASKPDGDFVASWFDDDACLWEDNRLRSAAPILKEWSAPELKLHGAEAEPTPVLFNPSGLAVSPSVRDQLLQFQEIEFLPVRISGCGSYFILHVTAAIELPIGTGLRVAPPPSGNIVEISSFSPAFEPQTALFRVLQPIGSAARQVGATTSDLFLSSWAAHVIREVAQGCLEARLVAVA